MFSPIFRNFVSIFLLLTAAPLLAQIDDSSQTNLSPSFTGIVKREEIPSLNIVILHLKNGMRVCLKQDKNQEQVLIRLKALGGYASLPQKYRASGQFASQVAIRSGVGEYHFDRLYASLYDHSMTFQSSIDVSSRYVGGRAYLRDQGMLFDLIHKYLTKPTMTEYSFNKVLSKEREQLINRRMSSKKFEQINRGLNTNYHPVLQPITVKDLEQADFEVSEKFHRLSFSDPSEFVCVIIGSINEKQMIPLIEKYLAAIPTSEKKTQHNQPVLLVPEKGVQKAYLENDNGCGESITRLSFPVKVPVTEQNYSKIEKLALYLNKKLKVLLREKYGSDNVIVNVSTEYPLYPLLTYPWISVQFIADKKFTLPMEKSLLSFIKQLQDSEVTPEEAEEVKRKFKKSQRAREQDREYSADFLSNYLLWNWDAQKLPTFFENYVDHQDLKKALGEYISIRDYKVVSSQL